MFNDTYNSFSLEEFAEILGVPCEGAYVFTDKWALYELASGLPGDGPYQTFLPSLDDIITLIRVDREGPVTYVHHKKEIDILEYQVLTREIDPTFKDIETILRENVFRLGGSRDHVSAYRCFMIYYIANSLNFNLDYFMAKRMEWRKPKRDRGTRKGRTSTSLTSAFGEPSSSHLTNDDEDVDHNEVYHNPPDIEPHLEPFYTRQTNRTVQLRDEQRGGILSLGKGIRNL
ncbi:hypothetical protein Tco_1458649 [Tanacetum coccineum]